MLAFRRAGIRVGSVLRSRAAAIAGALSIALALLMLFGWQLYQPTRGAIGPTFDSTEYPTAAGFLLGGAALILATSRRSKLSIPLAVMAGAFGSAALAEHALTFGLGFDPFSMKHGLPGVASFPARMLPNAAFCLALAGSSIAVVSWRPALKHWRSAVALASTVVAALASIAFFGNVLDLDSAHGWGHLVRMPIHDAVGFLMLAVGNLTLACRTFELGSRQASRCLAGFVAVAASTATLLLWQALGDQERETAVHTAQVLTDTLAQEFVSAAEDHLKALDLMRERAEVQDQPPERVWMADAEFYLEEFPAYRCIEWVDPDYRVRWIAQRPGQESAQNRNLAQGRLRKSFERALEADRLLLVRTTGPSPGSSELLAIAPIAARGIDSGFIVGILDIRQLVGHVAGKLDAPLAIRVSDAGQEIYRSADGVVGFESQRSSIALRDLDWTLEGSPLQSLLSKVQTGLPEVTLVAGIAVSCLLSLVVWLAERMRQQAGRLRHELAVRAATEFQLSEFSKRLDARNRDLERSNQELDDFAYIASHDLKEPLRGIHNYSAFLIEDYSERLDDAGREKLGTLMRLTRRMETLIDSLLYFARVGRTEIAVGDVCLQDVVEDVVESLRLSIEEAGIEIRIAEPLPTVPCDRARIGEVFRNLITNGMKYSDKPEKWIEIGCRTPNQAPRDTTSATGRVFYVRDNGIGIREKHLATIFRIFKRLHGRDKYGGGTGFGLTIAKKIIERHGGRIWLESRFGEGTTFYFTLEGAKDESSEHDDPRR